jgi:hypothetical protein
METTPRKRLKRWAIAALLAIPFWVVVYYVGFAIWNPNLL